MDANKIKPLIKWPGGKASEIKYIEYLIPKFDRYIEPFFGGGAAFFALRPTNAMVNDISSNLMDFYRFVKRQDPVFRRYINYYAAAFEQIFLSAIEKSDELVDIYRRFKNNSTGSVTQSLAKISDNILSEVNTEYLIPLMMPGPNNFSKIIYKSILSKMKRTLNNEKKKHFTEKELKDNLVTGFTSGFYLYAREFYNKMALNRLENIDKQLKIANFYFIREYCYGSMFRYNDKGEFNIPYGGISYNKKNLKLKIERIFSNDVEKLFKNTYISCSDFEVFLKNIELTDKDFVFLDPPYDTDFSDYEGKDFTKNDQLRLAEFLYNTKAKFIMIIKNTDYIYSLYKDKFNIYGFDKKYTYNVRSRNQQDVEHLIITNVSNQGYDMVNFLQKSYSLAIR